jgi:hypothetical protein
MISVDAFIAGYISRWEGRPGKYLSTDPNDNGNWYLPGAKAQKCGQGSCVGSNYGVTGATLAAFLGRTNITAADMKAVSLSTAAAIAKKLFYTQPGLAFLDWNRVTASVLDFGWGAGPVAAKKLLQDMIDAGQDGQIGSSTGETAIKFRAFIAKHGEEFAAGAWWTMREEYYEDLVARRPTDAIYLNGWDNRSDWFTPGNSEGWWGASA